MANLKIGGAHNEAGQKFFASNLLTTDNNAIYWDKKVLFHSGNFTISNDFSGNGTIENPLAWKGIIIQDKEGESLSQDVKTIKSGNNITFSVENGILTIDGEGSVKSINGNFPDETGNVTISTSSIQKIIIQRPVSDEELYPVLLASQTEDFSDTISIDPETQPDDRLKIKVFNGSRWIDFPSEGGLGTPFDNEEICFDVSEIEYAQPYYVKYAWKNSEKVFSNWKGGLFPSSIIIPSISEHSSEGNNGTVTSVNGILPDEEGDVTIPEVSISSPGLMTPEDKVKLDGLSQSSRQDIQFTSTDLQNGSLIVENCSVGSCTILDNVGNMIMAGQRQSGTNVVIDLSDVTITGNWTVKFIQGGGSGITLQYIQEQAVQAAIIFG